MNHGCAEENLKLVENERSKRKKKMREWGLDPGRVSGRATLTDSERERECDSELNVGRAKANRPKTPGRFAENKDTARNSRFFHGQNPATESSISVREGRKQRYSVAVLYTATDPSILLSHSTPPMRDSHFPASPGSARLILRTVASF
jgi:hypothetical protein